MAGQGLGFNNRGEFTLYPSAFVNVDASALQPRNQGATGVVAILGVGSGFFEPGKATSLPFDRGAPGRFIAPSDLLTAVEYATKPFPELDRSVSEILVVPVNKSTPSAQTPQHSVDATVGVLTLTSLGWGLPFNSLELKIEPALGRYTLRLPKTAVASGVDLTETYLHKNILVRYAELLAKLDADTGLTDTNYAATNPATTMAGLVAAYNATLAKLDLDATVGDADYASTVNATDTGNLHAQFAALLTKLDADSGVADGDYVTQLTVETVQQLVDQFNNRSGLVKATLVTESRVPDAQDFTAFTGGTEPTATTQDWDDAFHALDEKIVHTLCPVTPDPILHAMASAYCVEKELRGFVGRAQQNWNGVANRQAALQVLKREFAALNARRMMHTCIGGDGLDGHLSTAPRYAALAATLEPSTPMTQKLLDFVSLETNLDIKTEVGGVDGLLIAGGAPPVENPDAPGTFIVSRGLSTMVSSDNLYDREHSILAATDAFGREVKRKVRVFLGQEGTTGKIEQLRATANQVGFEALRPTAAVRINGFNPENTSATFADTVATINMAIEPIQPINFIPVNLRLERTDIAINVDVPLAA